MGVPLDSSGTEAQLSLCFTALPVRKALKLSFRWKSCFWKGWGFWSIIKVCLLHLRKMIVLGKQNISQQCLLRRSTLTSCCNTDFSLNDPFTHQQQMSMSAMMFACCGPKWLLNCVSSGAKPKLFDNPCTQCELLSKASCPGGKTLSCRAGAKGNKTKKSKWLA